MNRRRYVVCSLVALALAVALAACGMPGTIGAGAPLRPAGARPSPTPLPPVAFPTDEAPHHNLTEWWYYTGHMHGTDAAGRPHEYGFELTFFQSLRGQFPPYYAAHYAVSDITRGAFHYDQRAGFQPMSVIPPAGTATGFIVMLDAWSAQGSNGHDRLRADMPSYRLDVTLDTTKPPVLHGGNGIITYGLAGFSYYYSRTRMALSGTLVDHGQAVQVRGEAWMDHQWGDFVSLAGSGWDWYSIQLDNNTEYMLYVIRDSQKRALATFGTFVAADGHATELDPASIQPRALGTWTSPHTGGVYPSGWSIAIGGATPATLTLTLTPLLKDQELVTTQSTGVAYWEGAVAVRGEAGGRTLRGEGYVELTGYASLPPGNQSAAVP